MNTKRERHRGRPQRLVNVFIPDPVYFVTFCTWQKVSLLAHHEVNNAFCKAARELRIHSIAVGKYVIMPNHVHCFIRVGRGGNISLAVKALKRAITKVIHTAKTDARVWQEGFFDHILRSNESYSNKWEYVRANPVRAGLVKHGEDWPFQGEIEMIRW